jgi:flagellar hook-basal body complex protein FliE
MRIDPIVPDAAAGTALRSAVRPSGELSSFGQLVDAAGAVLAKADVAESAFAHGKGGLQEMVVERARADITLSIAVTGVPRAAQALNTLLGMQI